MDANPLIDGLAIFAAVALLQLPGKSNFAVITLATRHPHRDVFLGAAFGLALATVVSVTIGYGAETLLAPYLAWVKVAGGTVLIAFGIREILRRPTEVREPGTDPSGGPHDRRRVWGLALGLTFLLEMGDTTQVLAIVLVASTRNPLLVFVAAAAALVVIAAVSASGAGYLREHVPEERLRAVLGAVLIAAGTLTVLLTVWPGLLSVGG